MLDTYEESGVADLPLCGPGSQRNLAGGLCKAQGSCARHHRPGCVAEGAPAPRAGGGH